MGPTKKERKKGKEIKMKNHAGTFTERFCLSKIESGTPEAMAQLT